VKERPKMRLAETFFSAIKYAIRWVMVLVFPLPAPAKMSTGPSVCSTAARCSGFKRLKSSLKEGEDEDDF